jgi:photosystem II stability/assembly factor-like uncharacterized protein
MVARRPPRSTAIAGAVDLYADGPIVLAATHDGISRSTDGGVRWRTELSGYAMASVSRGPSGYFAVGGTVSGRRYVTATSPDGVRWSVVRARARRDNASFASAFGAASVMQGEVAVEATPPNRLLDGGPLMRTTDGGRHWHRVHNMSDAGGGLQLLPDGVMIATARGRGRDCDGAVWESVDLGATWREELGSCSGFPLSGVQFTSPDDGVAVGGLESKLGGGQIIETTADGGIRWTATHQVPNCQSARCQTGADDGLAGVDFQSALSGFVFEGVCPDSLPGPCGGELLWTGDGGRSLHRLASPPGDGWLSVAATGPGRYVGASAAPSGEKPSSAIGLSDDAGLHWRYEAPPDNFQTDDGDPLVGGGSHLLWRTPTSTVVSGNGGRTWQAIAHPRAARRRLRAYRRRIEARDGSTETIYRQSRWKLLDPGSAAYSWVLYRATPSAAWQGHRLPKRISDYVEALIATGPRTAVFVGLNGDLWRTVDGGAVWHQTWPALPGEGRGGPRSVAVA